MSWKNESATYGVYLFMDDRVHPPTREAMVVRPS